MSGPESLHRSPAEKQGNRRLVTVEVPPPQEPGRRQAEEGERAPEVTTKAYIQEITEKIFAQMHPREVAEWISRRSQEEQGSQVFFEALSSPEVFTAVKEMFLFRLRAALEANAKGGLLFWLLDFANGKYPRFRELSQDPEVAPLLQELYLLKLTHASRASVNDLTYLAQFKDLFSISPSPVKENLAQQKGLAQKTSRVTSPAATPVTSTSPSTSQATPPTSPPQFFARIKKFFGL